MRNCARSPPAPSSSAVRSPPTTAPHQALGRDRYQRGRQRVGSQSQHAPDPAGAPRPYVRDRVHRTADTGRQLLADLSVIALPRPEAFAHPIMNRQDLTATISPCRDGIAGHVRTPRVEKGSGRPPDRSDGEVPVALERSQLRRRTTASDDVRHAPGGPVPTRSTATQERGVGGRPRGRVGGTEREHCSHFGRPRLSDRETN